MRAAAAATHWAPTTRAGARCWQHTPARLHVRHPARPVPPSAAMASGGARSAQVQDGVVHLISRQLDLYNARDLEGFMDLFTEDIIATDAVTGAILASGKANLRPRYVERFKTPVHAQLLGRLCLGAVVVDRELITGLPDGVEADCLATYVVDTSTQPFKIAKMSFVWSPRG